MLASAENNHNPIAKYATNTDKENINPDNNVFLLSLCLLSIAESNNNITAKAQGLILSANAAGIIIPKKLNLLRRMALSSSF